MKKLVVANWKMNPQSYAEAERLARAVLKLNRGLKNVETVLCPPFTWLTDLSHKYARKIAFGAQDVFWQPKGAFTGEISPDMLRSSKVSYVIIGHSERRRHLGETDEMVNKKIHAALGNGLRIILCIGESLQEHKRGQTKSILRRQLKKDLAKISPSLIPYPLSLAIAYEPIWAIGTGLPETPKNADNVAKFIRRELAKHFPKKIANNIRIIYGGSVDSRNIIGYLAMTQIIGALVGGASLNAKDFIKILQIADQI